MYKLVCFPVILFIFFSALLIASCGDSKTIDDGPDRPGLLTAWAPVGAKWYYTLSCINGPSPSDCDTYYTIESVKDTTVSPGSVHARVLKVRRHSKNKVEDMGNEVMYGDLSKVYHYDKNKGAFYLLYDFRAEKGDTLKIRTSEFINYWGNLSNQFIEVVKEVVDMPVNNQNLRQLTTTPVIDNQSQQATAWTYAIGGGEATLIQGIGSTYWMFGGNLAAVAAEHGHLGLRCFEVQGKVLYKDPSFDLECDHMNNN